MSRPPTLEELFLRHYETPSDPAGPGDAGGGAAPGGADGASRARDADADRGRAERR